MKTPFFTSAFILAAVITGLGDEVQLSTQLTDVLKLSKAQVSPGVIKSFIESSRFPSSPSSAQILYLRSQGVSDDVIAALAARGIELRSQTAAAAGGSSAEASPVPTPATPAPSAIAPTNTPVYPSEDQSAPIVQNVVSGPHVVSAPYYVYSDYYWGPGYWGWGGAAYVWTGPGWRWRGGGGRLGGRFGDGGGGGFHGGMSSGGGFRGGGGGGHGR